MLMVRKRGGAAGDLEPILCCQVCHRVMSLMEAWLGFPAVTEQTPQRPVVWLHKDCASGQAVALFDTPKMTLWRALDCFQRLMRATEANWIV
jgi:hypothetical protein